MSVNPLSKENIMVIGAGIFALLIFLVMRASKSDHEAVFYDRPCGYCDMGVHLDKKTTTWLHDDGTMYGIADPSHPKVSHRAHPGGMLS